MTLSPAGSSVRRQGHPVAWTYRGWHALPWNPATSNLGPGSECPASGVYPKALLWCASNQKGPPMPLSINKVGADENAGSSQSPADAKALMDSLMKVVACYRQLSSCVGGCTDSVDLRHQLRRTREWAQELATANRQCLTTRLRDKHLPEEERREAELLWVAFSSSLELLHADMCKVFHMGQSFSLSAKAKTFVQTGIQGTVGPGAPVE
ncbi:hypothetical protein SKAU_G00384770 [Synaphobranchus kaupii]|uniref:Uncharacterized protein n=1 Tax=Synaphobranchus kaupii TaxID=118154 RepID=A0A9Q1EED3_SYNKA|nr:hypothetical protein SKAU_G00384770 [Synaphobranchus kaupii]